jgi:DUF4097 and DUF4098 domain-containing protein YvlB
MSKPKGLGFGGFLIGVGAGWLIFRYITLTADIAAWLLVIAGGAIIASSILSYLSRGIPLTGMVSWLAVGMIIALLTTSGPAQFFSNDWVTGVYPYSTEASMNFPGAATESTVLFSVENVNGQIEVDTWDRDEYNIDVTVKAKGTTEEDAQDALEEVDITIDDRITAGRRELILTISVPRMTWRKISVSMTVTLPADATIDLDLITTNGNIKTSNIVGGDLSLQSTNGEVAFNHVYAPKITSLTTNGRIRGHVEAGILTATTTNGQIDLTLPSTRSGSYTLSNTNGGIEVNIASSENTGFDLDLRTTSGETTVDIEGLTYDTDTAKHKSAQSTGYASKTIQIEVDASNTNGSITVD